MPIVTTQTYKVYAESDSAAQLKPIVQDYNMKRKDIDEAEVKHVTTEITDTKHKEGGTNQYKDDVDWSVFIDDISHEPNTDSDDDMLSHDNLHEPTRKRKLHNVGKVSEKKTKRESKGQVAVSPLPKHPYMPSRQPQNVTSFEPKPHLGNHINLPSTSIEKRPMLSFTAESLEKMLVGKKEDKSMKHVDTVQKNIGQVLPTQETIKKTDKVTKHDSEWGLFVDSDNSTEENDESEEDLIDWYQNE